VGLRVMQHQVQEIEAQNRAEARGKVSKQAGQIAVLEDGFRNIQERLVGDGFQSNPLRRAPKNQYSGAGLKGAEKCPSPQAQESRSQKFRIQKVAPRVSKGTTIDGLASARLEE
jgi:hypothetical protein